MVLGTSSWAVNVARGPFWGPFGSSGFFEMGNIEGNGDLED